MNDDLMLIDGVGRAEYLAVSEAGSSHVDGSIAAETRLCVSVNGLELASFMCTPVAQQDLALGFLLNEGIINSDDDLRAVTLSRSGTCVDVWLVTEEFEPPERLIVTSGCGGGLTYDDLAGDKEPLVFDGRVVDSGQLSKLMMDLHRGAHLYRDARGIHAAALANKDGLMMVAEDLGRHNCLDKLRGRSLRQGIVTRDMMLFSTGRISSEMIGKAYAMGIGLICSRTSPTNLSVKLAKEWGITLIGYLRQGRMRIYSHAERVSIA